MAAVLQLPSPATRRPYLRRSVSAIKFPRRGRESIIGLRMKEMRIDLRMKCIGKSEGVAEMFLSPPPLVNLVKDFYERINKKDMKKLSELLDNSCFFEDLAFPSPFKGKQAVYHFLEELSTAMGKNVRFRIDDVFGEGKQNAGARWHLEWNDRIIPFTKGCSFFYCSDNSTGLLIKKACIFVESPMKPGAVVLDLLRVVTSFFDKFPKLAVWFLEKPQVLSQILMKAYKIFMEPLILPFFIYHTHLWTYGARLLSFVINILLNILKSFM